MRRSITIGAAALAFVVSAPLFCTAVAPASAQERRDRDRYRDWRGPDQDWRDRDARRGRDERDEHEREDAALRDARLTLEDAIAVARREIPSGRVVDADVETARGVVSYAIDIDDRDGVKRVLVDLRTGDVLSVFPKRDDEDEDEDDD